MLNKILRFIVYRLRRILFPAVAWKYTYPRDRGTPPQVHTDELRREYEHGPLAGEPDTFVLYRIIGNDLVPRHKKGQSRENLRFILENEPELEACEKRWVVNRIVDREEEKAILELLKEHDQRYIHFPFDWDEYAKVPWDLDGAPYPGFSYSLAHDFMPEPVQARYLTRLYRHKNNYVMHNNGARNAALREGRTLAKWALPWDGNCFVTAQAWDEIRSQVTTSPWYPYFIVPMARLTDNAELLDPEFRPEARDEPQILFRRDAEEEFNEEHPYGRRPKVELFWRLGVPGKWDRWGLEPWDLPCPGYAHEAGRFSYAGWVARLFSGQSRMETPGKGAYRQRHLARVEGITGFLEQLDEHVVGQRYSPSDMTAYDEASLAHLRDHAREAPDSFSAEMVSKLMHAAEATSENGPSYDYQQIAGDENHRSYRQITISALAWYFGNNDHHAEHGASLLRKLLTEPGEQTKQHPHADIYFLPDAVRLLSRAKTLEQTEIEGLERRFRKDLARLRHSRQGRSARRARDRRGTFHDLSIASLAAWLGDTRLLLDTLRICRERLLQQFEADGRQPVELRAHSPIRASCLNLHAWSQLAYLAALVDEDLWYFNIKYCGSLKQGLAWTLREFGTSPEHSALLAPLYVTFIRHYGKTALPDGIQHPITVNDNPETLPCSGIKPFWMIDSKLYWDGAD